MGRGGRGRGPKPGKGKGTFNPEDETHVKHTKLGVWDLYKETQPELQNIPGSSRLEPYLEMYQSMPFVWKMIQDIGSIRSCWVMLATYLVFVVLAALIPAVSLWYSGQLLRIVESAVDQRKVDTTLLMRVAAGRVMCTVASRVLSFGRNRVQLPLNKRIKQHYSTHIFQSMSRLDVPTFDDPAVQRQLEAATSSSGRSSVCWDTLQTFMHVMSTVIKLFSQMSVLVAVLRDQRDGPLLAVLSFAESIFQWISARRRFIDSGVWAATCNNDDFLRMEGLKRLIDDPIHRKEIVAGNMANYLSEQFRTVVARLGDKAGQFPELMRDNMMKDRLSFSSLIREPLRELPQIVFTLRAVQYPATIPLSLASLHLIQENASSFSTSIFDLLDKTANVAEQLASVRKLYEIDSIRNKIPDGKEPFPENRQTLLNGISVEFKNVSFIYPGTEKLALDKVSFKVGPGQLCIIVGANGSGKSTILKLIARIYDPSEGEILIDGRNIQSLRLEDLRAAISVLFQDYTHFPLSIKENIGLGDPENAHDEDKVIEAARLGGAEEFVERLPEGFDTYLDRPVRDHYSGIPEGTKTLFGRPVSFSRVRGAGGMQTTNTTSLSGGQMQRLAVARTFMRTTTSEPKVGLLLFDEPSASLDPTAEHDLFQRLRNLRGNKSMIFSSHRFGNLTRHADLILYMNDSVVVEEGTHDELLKRQGEYARIWGLQAQAFLP
ncbi:P-loop containing nucleoside triphosphate hydrolase protein [Athelia psychrophila]|uniref:P-loop containing nucleoside triphosphate hydrolase protein n=2 Tax=Athelia psychrophila TaxID=1759441 RepID=A0A166TA36_9AGAM|nr:P-loop containing nucleoside triphosphate hydrolase protein [Fibularhizoctonia sp. CBS 109695]